MKISNPRITIFLIMTILLIVNFSCDKPNFDGHWHVYYGQEREPSPFLWDIRNDSLFSKDSYTLGPDSFKIRRNKIEIIWPEDTWAYTYKFYGDSCLLFNKDTLKLVLYKKHNCKLYDHEIELKINLNLPDCSKNEIETIDENDSLMYITSFIYLGQPFDSTKNKYLQLNDKLSEPSDLIYFVSGYSPIRLILMVDSSLKMKRLDEIIFLLRYHQFQRVYFALDITDDYSKLGLIRKKLNGIENLSYYKTHGKFEEMPPPPPSTVITKNLLTDIKSVGFKFYLKKNKLLLTDNKTIDYEKLKDTLHSYLTSRLKDKAYIFFEWDTASVFDTYAKTSVILENAWKNYRKQAAKINYHKTYDELTKDEVYNLKNEYPANLIEISPADRYAINKKYGNRFH
jgi:hypothetical protein